MVLKNRRRSSSSVNEHRNLRRPGTAPMRIKQTQTFYAYENVGDEKNDDSGFIESDVDDDASFYNYDILPSVMVILILMIMRIWKKSQSVGT
tara:strand:- start:638 stop:913 length:276 start_codon:yes stop_codon:yes gene_type:complete